MAHKSYLLVLLLSLFTQSVYAEELPVLFLGGKSHHQPEQLYLSIKPYLESKGINVTYTEDMNKLSAEGLKPYAGLIVFANTTEITESQLQALLKFVEQDGKGFIPLHCASYCFIKSEPYIALVGAQFKKHGGRIVSVKNVAPSHPIMQNFPGFSSWDETYVHHKHNDKDRTILEYREGDEQAEGNTREPWTWVRTQGKGRIFYTAWGHDARTWNQPGFQNLVARGIFWACHQDPQNAGTYVAQTPFTGTEMTPLPQGLKPFEFVDVGPKIPVYTSGAKWGTQEKPSTVMQLPLTPKESMKHYSVPVGFELKLYASEEHFIAKPVAMNWDHRGRLWICETLDYPNELQEPGKGRDRIRICEDTNHDGTADKFTVFAEGLSIPTAIVCCRGGAVVQNATETLFLKDTNGDDVADVKKVLMTGWNCVDTHGGVSNFQLGQDNWIWAMQGYNNSKPVAEGKAYPEFRAGYFRFKLDHSDPPKVVDLEFLKSSSFGNTWGLGLTEEGLAFASSANRAPSLFMPIPNRYYEKVKGWAGGHMSASGIFDTHIFKPITDKIRQVDHHGGYTAAAGHAIYTARRYPQHWWNQTGFVCGPTGHLVGVFSLTPKGVDFSATSPSNLVASNDEWAAPIMAEVGPDGNVWVLDWYNFIVQHNPTPAGFATGKGRAYESDLRDKRHGRIYRVEYPTTEKVRTELNPHDAKDLLAGLVDSNMLWRKHAQNLLIERAKTDVVPELLKLILNQQVDTVGTNYSAQHAIWTLRGLNVINDQHPEVLKVITSALKHPAWGVRKAALENLPAGQAAAESIVSAGMLEDQHVQVKLAAILSLADQAPDSQAATGLLSSINKESTLTDPWLEDAYIAAVAAHADQFILQVLKASMNSNAKAQVKMNPTMLKAVTIAAGHLARSEPQAEFVEQLIGLLPTSKPELAEQILLGLKESWPAKHTIQTNSKAQAEFLVYVKSASSLVKSSAIQLAPQWGMQDSIQALAGELTAALMSQIENSQTKDKDREIAFTQLVELQPESDELVVKLLDMVTPQASPALISSIFNSILNSKAKGLADEVLNRLSSMTPDTKALAIGTLLGRTESTNKLLQGIEAGKLTLQDLKLDQLQALSAHPNKKTRELAISIMKKGGSLPNADREKIVQQYMSLTTQHGDAVAGKAVFKQHCAKCHKHYGEGENIGPDLTGMAVHPKTEMLVNIMDPSRSVETNYRSYSILTTDGRSRSGMLLAESRTSLDLIDAEAKKTSILREDILQLQASTKSLMPEGFEKLLKEEDLRNLLEFLATKGKYIPIPLDKVATAISTKSLFEQNPLDDGPDRLVLKTWGTVTVENVPFVLVDPQEKRNKNIILLHGPNGQLPPSMPKSVKIPCQTEAKAIHLLSGVGGWSFPAIREKSVSMIVRLHYEDGSSEDHPLLNGVHFADYISKQEVPQSKFAFKCGDQQMRYLKIDPKKPTRIKEVEFVKGSDDSSPIIMSVTIEPLSSSAGH